MLASTHARWRAAEGHTEQRVVSDVTAGELASPRQRIEVVNLHLASALAGSAP